jgi:hypothetical protein
MKEMFDQWQSGMEKMWGSWPQMMKDAPWMQKPDMAFKGKGSAWISIIRSTCEVNLSWWKIFMDQGEEIFFKMLKESPMYNAHLEEQMREFWELIRKSRSGFQETVNDQLDKMEALLKEHEEHR